ncbi:nucleoporin 62 like [Corythoichthys intestinalis]|uniref:nucleoporin 62 like n=1 Tax=Corythoichthys intestinalis TaxID=161448 RepID=UPI0025A67C84|nr:nucleoporin 62 like [Corythoichthys intestinalis]XP_061799648.1 nuclear pore glycoprotein p62-like [Nerophis lumbriciformis]
MSGGFNFGQPSTGFSFGAAKTTATAAPTFGLTTSTPAATVGSGGFTFGSAPQTGASSNPTGGFSFGTPAKSGSAGGSLAFGTPTTTTFSLGSTPQAAPAAGLTLGTSAAPTSTASSGFSLGSGSTASTGFSFGAQTQPPAQTQPAAAAPAAAPAPTTTASGGLSFGGFSFGSNKVQVAPTATTASATGGGFSFGSNAAPILTLGTQATTTTAATAPQGGGFTLGIKPSTTPAPPAVTQAAPSLFSAPTTTTAAAPTTGFSFGAAPIQAAAPTATTTASGGLSFTLKPLGTVTSSTAPASAAPATTTTAGFSLGLKPSSGTSVITTTSTAVAPIVTAAPAVMTYAQLEALINKWSLELEDQERHFLQQATQVNAWDRMLVENGEKITSLHKEMEKVKLDQKRLNQELDFILSQQKELEDLLCPLEESVKEQSGTIYMQNADEERERTYKLAENVDAQLKRMSQDLKEIIEHLNTSSGPADTSDPLQQICKILNAHMDSLQWIDQNSVLLQRRVEEVSKLCDNQRKEQEKTFRLTFD